MIDRQRFLQWSFFAALLLVLWVGFGAPALARRRDVALFSSVALWREAQETQSLVTPEELYDAVRETHDLPSMDALTFEEETDTVLRFSYDRFSPEERFVFQGEEFTFPEGVYTRDVVFRRASNQWALEQF